MPIFREILLEQLACDPDQPRKEFGTESETNALKENIEAEGIEVPLAVWSVPLKLDTYSHLADTLKSYGKAHRKLNEGSVRG